MIYLYILIAAVVITWIIGAMFASDEKCHHCGSPNITYDEGYGKTFCEDCRRSWKS